MWMYIFFTKVVNNSWEHSQCLRAENACVSTAVRSYLSSLAFILCFRAVSYNILVAIQAQELIQLPRLIYESFLVGSALILSRLSACVPAVLRSS